MKVKSLVRLRHLQVYFDTPLTKVWVLLSKREISLLPVVSPSHKLEGVIGEDDLLYRLVPDYREYFSDFFPEAPDLDDIEDKFDREMTLTAKDVMNKEVISINENQLLFKALSKMMAYHVRSLPVVDEERKYKGMIVEDDIMTYLLKKHKHLLGKKK